MKKMLAILKIGDKVLWSGSWGRDAEKEATIVSMEKVPTGEKEGESISQIPWPYVRDNVVVDLDNGHWAYGFQIHASPTFNYDIVKEEM